MLTTDEKIATVMTSVDSGFNSTNSRCNGDMWA
jgi:hypothetical protein